MKRFNINMTFRVGACMPLLLVAIYIPYTHITEKIQHAQT